MLVHSYLYYRLNTQLITDADFDRRARELADLQALRPGPLGYYDLVFKGWTGDTGYHLPMSEPAIIGLAESLCSRR